MANKTALEIAKDCLQNPDLYRDDERTLSKEVIRLTKENRIITSNKDRIGRMWDKQSETLKSAEKILAASQIRLLGWEEDAAEWISKYGTKVEGE